MHIRIKYTYANEIKIDKKVIEKAKEFAIQSNRSLSDIVETYLERITNKNVNDVDNELSKIIGVIQLPDDFDDKKEIRRILTSKQHCTILLMKK